MVLNRLIVRVRTFHTASLMLFVLLAAAFMQVRQQEKFLSGNASAYDKAVKLYDKGDFASAAPIFGELLRRDTNSWILAAHYGRCLGETGRLTEASTYYARALEGNVLLMQNGNFLVPWGYYSYLAKEYDKARVLLEASLETSLPTNLAVTARRLLDDIKQKEAKR